MKVSGMCCCSIVILLLLSTSSDGGRVKRSISEFGDMIRAKVGREALLYNNYGNHCGFQGGDRPVVDEVDRCCYNHDRCYEQVNIGACSSSWVGPAFKRYSWSWNTTHLHCGTDNDACEMASCVCDMTAANCFSIHPWNQQHKHYSVWDILA